MNSVSKEKAKFRQSAKWKKFRIFIAAKYGKKDYVTGKKLLKGFQVHHLDLVPEHYKNLDEDNFLPCNRLTHEMIHWLYRYYDKDPAVLERLGEVMEKMKEINGGDNVQG